MEADEIEIVKTYRVNLIKKSANIPMIKEVIPAGKKVHFRIQAKAKKDYHELDNRFSYLYETADALGEREILRRVNEFAIDLLTAEIKTLKEYAGHERAMIIHLYERLLAIAKQFDREQNGCVLRLGSGKTYFDNTVSRLFSDKEIEKLPLRKKGKGLFPRTRTVTSNQGIYDSVLGWAKIQLQQAGNDSWQEY